MPRGPKGEKRPANTVENAMLIGRIAKTHYRVFRSAHHKPIHSPPTVCPQVANSAR
jgi:hypothetical protein